MKKTFYFLSPVEVVKVTSNNLEEVAEWCGGKVAQTESRRNPGRMDSYVWVPTPSGTKLSWAFPGMFITKRVVVSMKDELKTTFSVFRKEYFEKNFFESPLAAVDGTWDRKTNTNPTTSVIKDQQKQPGEPVVVIDLGEVSEEIATALENEFNPTADKNVG